MKAFFDSSVLVAAFLADHENHEASLAAFAGASVKNGYCAAHSLAEVYAILTRLPVSHRVAGEHALLFVEEICGRLNLVELTGRQYQAVITHSARTGIAGGAVYDALILQCAVKVRAETILTWNLRDFRRIAPDIVSIIRTPG